MIVEVTMTASHAIIESQDQKFCMHAPLIGPLRARMQGREKALFHAEVSGSSLELGDAIRERVLPGVK